MVTSSFSANRMAGMKSVCCADIREMYLIWFTVTLWDRVKIKGQIANGQKLYNDVRVSPAN